MLLTVLLKPLRRCGPELLDPPSAACFSASSAQVALVDNTRRLEPMAPERP